MISDTSIIFYAFRYALGRKTYAVNDVVAAIISVWDTLPPTDQLLYHREIKEAIALGKAGMDMDVKEWKKILDFKVKNIY